MSEIIKQLIEKWRTESDDLLEMREATMPFDGGAASRLIVRANTLSKCANELSELTPTPLTPGVTTEKQTSASRPRKSLKVSCTHLELNQKPSDP